MLKIFRIIIWLIADIIFVNMAFYIAYLIRLNGMIQPEPFMPYTHLWPYITLTHLIIFSIFGLYKYSVTPTKKIIFINTLYASTVAALASMSIVYTMRHFTGLIPSSIFALAWFFNIILISGWRAFIRYEPPG